jgi:starvation-inducible DNA-binding protein
MPLAEGQCDWKISQAIGKDPQPRPGRSSNHWRKQRKPEAFFQHDERDFEMTTTTSRSNRSNDVVAALNTLLADTFALYVKTKNFHWHLSGPHFRDYHLMFDDQASQIFATTDVIAERVRKIGGQTLKSIGQIARLKHLSDNDAEGVAARDMLEQLLQDNRAIAREMHEVHTLCDETGDVATASLLENWIDEADGRAWFLLEAQQPG